MDGLGEGNSYIDSSVGALVWVRRRNGSWWPGRILAPEELPGSHLLSPRTGTPVKLLGREDGSVDWYNIEKSRRVKAFRCGEFDECIEKARGLANFLTKKREKYARREDAILHALELERKHEEERAIWRGYYEEQSFKDTSGLVDDVGLEDDFGSDFIDADSSADIAQTSLDDQFDKFLAVKWEDETAPQMRDMEDFSLRKVTSNERLRLTAACEEAPTFPLTVDQKFSSCEMNGSSFGLIHANGPNFVPSTLKRKRSNFGSNLSTNAYKKRDQQKTTNQGLENVIPESHVESSVSEPSFVRLQAERQSVLCHSQEITFTLPEKQLYMPSQHLPDIVHEAHQVSRLRHNMLEPIPVSNKPNSNFYSGSREICSDLRELSVREASQINLTSCRGSMYADSLLTGVSAVNSPYFMGSIHAGLATGIIDAGFVKHERLPCVPNFQGWPDFGGLHAICERSENDFPVLNHVINHEPSMNEYLTSSLDSAIHAHEENMSQNFSSNGNTLVGEGKLLSEGAIGRSFSNAAKSAKIPESGGCAAKEEGREDESLQTVPASYFASSEDVAFGSESHLKQGFGTQQKNTVVKVVGLEDGLCDKGNLMTAMSHGSFNAGTSKMNDDNSISRLMSRIKQCSGTHGKTHLSTLLRWQLKRRRSNRRFARNASRLTSVAIQGICSHGGSFDHTSMKTSSANRWVPIHLEVPEIIQVEPVPLVSLTSKLSRKLIIGHPIFVERVHRPSQGMCEHGSLPVPPVTGRRTAMLRVPRNCASVVSGDFGGLLLKQGQQTCNWCTAVVSHKVRIKRRKSTCIRCPPLEMSLSMFPKKVGMCSPVSAQLDTGCSAQKAARMLSSTSVDQRNGANITSDLSAEQPMITCVPVSLVFNRIREALYKQQTFAPSDSDGLSIEAHGKETST